MPYTNKKTLIAYLLFSCMLFLSSCIGGLKLPDALTGADPVQEWLQTLTGRSSAEQSEMAAQVWSDNSQSTELRNRAIFILATRYNSQTNIALSSLATQYQAASLEGKIYIEETLDSDLLASTNDDIHKILGLITPDLEAKFPYSLVIYAAAKRNLLQNSQGVMKILSSHKYFHSPKVIGLEVAEPFEKANGGSLALLLPQSGNISPITKQIIAGAEAARTHLKAKGINWQVHYIDTLNPQWLQLVNALPKDCVTIGGPLQTHDYNTLKANNIFQDRTIFAFLPRLPDPADEGVLAWQFFTKPEDQINAVLNISSQSLGIQSFGVFAPSSPYGKSIENLFTQMAKSRGFSVQSANYPVDDLKSWTKISKNFLDSRIYDEKKLPKVNAPFDAIFFPDAWRNIDLLISTMHYHGANEKIMLGNALWEQSLNQPQNFNPTTFALTLFPVAYDQERATPLNEEFAASIKSTGVNPTDWSALGFDFIMMINELNLTKKVNSSSINSRLSTLQTTYVSAPFHWTTQGIASRNLFIDQPARSGRVPLDITKFLQYRTAGGSLPNISKQVLTEELMKTQEKQALEEIDALIDSIMSTSTIPN